MAEWQFPIHELYTETVAALTAASITTPHAFGLKNKAAHGVAPRYVWYPTRSRDRVMSVSRSVDEHRDLFATREHFEIHCWGATFRQAWALRQNVIRAIQTLIQLEAKIENGRWEHPAEAQNQAGELYILEMSMACPVIDAYVDPTELEVPSPETFYATRIDGQIYSVDSTSDDDGELGPETSTT